MKYIIHQITLIVFLSHCFCGCKAQQVLLKKLEVIEIHSKDTAQKNVIDTLVIQFEADNLAAIDYVYYHFGYIDKQDCNLITKLARVQNKNGTYYLITLKGQEVLITGKTIRVPFYVREYNLTKINDVRVKISDNKGEYSKDIFYKDSEKRINIPCPPEKQKGDK